MDNQIKLGIVTIAASAVITVTSMAYILVVKAYSMDNQK